MAGVCARTGCADEARSLLLFDPAGGTARLLDLADDLIGAVPLCNAHADRFNVPSGWTLADERTEEPEGVALLLGVTDADASEPEPDSPLLKRAFRVLS